MNEEFCFNVAVVGSDEMMSPMELIRLLDVMVNRHRGERKIALLSTGGSPGSGWARVNGYTTFLVPTCGNRVKRDCELTARADAVVILGDPGPWRNLRRLCEEAGVPVRVYTKRPKLPPTPPAAWEIDD